MHPGTLPYFFAALLSLANWVLAVRFLPESLAPERRRRREVRSGFFTARRFREAVRRPQVGLLFLLFFTSTAAVSMMEATLILFGEQRMDMTPVQAGRFLGYVGLLMVIVQGGLVGRLARRFGERALLVTGAFLMVPGLLLIAPAYNYPFLAVAMIPLAVGSGISHPSLGALLSRRSRGDEQGGVLGTNQSLGSLARVIGPAVGTGLFQSLGIGSPYLAGGALMLLTAFLSLLVVQPATAPAEVARTEAES